MSIVYDSTSTAGMVTRSSLTDSSLVHIAFRGSCDKTSTSTVIDRTASAIRARKFKLENDSEGCLSLNLDSNESSPF